MGGMMKGVSVLFLFVCICVIVESRRLLKAPDVNYIPEPPSKRRAALAALFPGNESSVSGYIDFPVDDNVFHFFYWFFEARSRKPDAPTVFWFQGGPGCSSMSGLFNELGPYQFVNLSDPNSELYLNPYSWNNEANLVFLDQPVQTGFSFSDDDAFEKNEDEVAADVGLFFQGFYKEYPNLLANPLYITGESYFGHYGPAIAQWFAQHTEFGFPFAGIAIGNGLVQVSEQFPSFGPFAFENNLITEKELKKSISLLKPCEEKLTAKQYIEAEPLCNQVLGFVVNAAGIQNVYDIRQDKPYDFAAAATFLNREDVQSALGVPKGIQWVECSGPVNQRFGADVMEPQSQKLIPVLAGNYSVLLYTGVEDFLVNVLGAIDWQEKLEWSGQKRFNSASYSDVKVTLVNGTSINSGKWKVANNLAFYQVLNSGHLMPMNSPQVALNLINTLLNDGWRE